MQEKRVLFLDWEDPLERGMATTPVFLPEESHGQRSLDGYSPEGCKELDTTEQLHTHNTNKQAGLRKGRGTRNQIANIHCIIEKAREFQKNIYFCFTDYTKAFDCEDNNKLWKFFKRWEYQTTSSASCETYMQVKKQQLELNMEQWAGSKLGKEYIRTIYCHPAY